MRKIMLILAVCVALTACKKEVLTKGTPFQKGQTVTISAGAGGGSDAKVEGFDNGSVINFKWNEGDEIKVTVGGASSIFRLKEGAGTASAKFEGTMPASGTHFDIQYPVDDPDLSTQQYVANGIQKGLVKFTATNCTLNNTANLTMASAILKLQFTGTETVSKIVVNTVDYTPAKSYTLNISGVTLSSTPTTFLMVVDPMTTKLRATLYDNTSDMITSFTTSTAQNLTAGGCLSMSEKPVVADPKGLCFTALEAGCTVAMTGAPNLLKSTDNGVSFQVWDGSTITLTNVGDKVYIKASSTGNTSINKSFATDGDLKVSGNIMYLLKGDGSQTTTIPSNYCFKKLFYKCSIKDASELLLPATTLAMHCYYQMFNGCSNLTAAPALPATTLQESCYYQMFYKCTSLTAAPALPATTLGKSCYGQMFYGCSNLTTAPALPATTLVALCYSGMFTNCTSLTTAPSLPATTLMPECYYQMFYKCTSLTAAPALPATTLEKSCYCQMFYGCSNLTTAPALPATTLGEYCYCQMFYGCSNLTTAPALPATTLGEYCYYQMFYGCSNLTTAPALPATTLEKNCYRQMFKNCSKLKSVKMLATTVTAQACLSDWLLDAGTVGSGTNYVHVASGMTTNQTIIDNSSGWTLTNP